MDWERFFPYQQYESNFARSPESKIVLENNISNGILV